MYSISMLRYSQASNGLLRFWYSNYTKNIVHNSMTSEVKALIYLNTSSFYWKLIFVCFFYLRKICILWPWYIMSKQKMIYWTYWQVSNSWFIRHLTKEYTGTVNNIYRCNAHVLHLDNKCRSSVPTLKIHFILSRIDKCNKW